MDEDWNLYAVFY